MDASLEFIGTATTLLRLGPHTLLTDPDFRHRGHRAYLGNGLFSKRRTEPARQPEGLPRLDGVLLSHLHGDHFDRIARERLDRDLPVLTTPRAGRRLGRWGFEGAYGMSTWESVRLAQDLTVTSVPGQHAPGLLVTMDADQGADLVTLIGAPVTVPVHYDDYTVFRSPLEDFVRRAPGLPTTVRTVGRGETVALL